MLFLKFLLLLGVRHLLLLAWHLLLEAMHLLLEAMLFLSFPFFFRTYTSDRGSLKVPFRTGHNAS